MAGENKNLVRSIQQFSSLLDRLALKPPDFRHLYTAPLPGYARKRKTLLRAGFCKVNTPGN
jgi:hypothetical protein